MSSGTFEGTFEDEESGSSEASSSGDEESSVEESSDEEVPMSKSEIPFDQKVEMFNKSGKVQSASDSDSEDGFDDEESESESGSEYSDESGDDSSEGSSESGSYYSEKDGRESFMNEQERLRGMGSIHSNSRCRKWYVIGLAIFCVILLGLAIGLGVGLSRRNKKDDDDKEKGGDASAPAEAPTLPDGTAPAGPPVRMPVKLPNPPKIGEEEPIEEVVLVEEAVGDITIYRSGGPEDGDDPEKGTLLVSFVDPNSIALFEFPVPDEVADLRSINNATFCLEHVPNEEDPDRVVTYSICIIDEKAPPDGVESETSEIYNDSCFSSLSENFDVSPGDTEVCVDISGLIRNVFYDRFNVGRRALEEAPEFTNLAIMIESIFEVDGPGDEFYSKDNEEGKSAPKLTLTSRSLAECNTIFDFICSDDRLKTLCGNLKDVEADGLLSDRSQMADIYAVGPPFTIFAPTDDAFARLPVSLGWAEDEDLLSDALMYHVVLDPISSFFLDCSQGDLPPLQMMSGDTTTIECDSDSTFIVGDGNTDVKPKIIEADIKTCNGIVHVIDNVLIPGTTDTDMDMGGESESGDEECMTIGEAVCSDEELGGICQLYNTFKTDEQIGGLFEKLNTETTTLFLPNTQAAMALSSLAVGDSGITTQPIVDLLLNHAISDLFLADGLECDAEVEMEGGDVTKTVCEGDDKFQVGDFNDDSTMPKIIVADIVYCTGVIHVIDSVILTKELDIVGDIGV